jgi:molybdopterin synthase catalytic subunit
VTSVSPRATSDSAAVRLIALRDRALDVGEVTAAVSDPAAGGLTVFVGAVRDHDGGQAVARLEYTAHPSAEERLAEVAAEVADEFDVVAVAAVHRVGVLDIGDLAVVSAVSAAHRGTAFEASRALIDRLKQRVPIWKHQQFADGSDEWVNTP